MIMKQKPFLKSAKHTIAGGLSILLAGCAITSDEPTYTPMQQSSQLRPVASYLASSFSRDDLHIFETVDYLNGANLSEMPISVSAHLMLYQLTLGQNADAVKTAQVVYNDTLADYNDRVSASMILASYAIGRADYTAAVQYLSLKPSRELDKIGYSMMRAWSYVGTGNLQQGEICFI